MGKKFKELSSKHIKFIEQQKLFFVGTAAEAGTINISPKGGDSLRILNLSQVIWLNLTGSGNETSAHVQLNSRMTLMFCAFDGSPFILRLYGSAQVFHRCDEQWPQYITVFPNSVASRQIYLLDIELVQVSCGSSVPFFDYVRDRTELTEWSAKQGTKGIERYWAKKNQSSIDGFETNIVARTGIPKLVS